MASAIFLFPPPEVSTLGTAKWAGTIATAAGCQLVATCDLAIASDQAVFDSAATNGANSLDPLTGVVIAASLLMAIGCGWGLTRRLAEYR